MCVFEGVCEWVCVCAVQTLKPSQMGVLFSISHFLTLLLQGQGRLRLYDSPSLVSTYSHTYIQQQTYLSSLHYVSHFLFALLWNKLKRSLSSSTAVTHVSFIFRALYCDSELKLDVHWLQINGRRMPWWIQCCFCIFYVNIYAACIRAAITVSSSSTQMANRGVSRMLMTSGCKGSIRV